jgi:hypothetical protein
MAAAGVVVCALASAESIRLAIADQAASAGDENGFRRAAQIAPENARYHYRFAVEAGGTDTAELDTALKLNPRYSAAWIERGLRKEFEGDLREAERSFLEAARVDRGYLPRWTLANYYFRREDTGAFFRWAKQAAWISYGDLRLLFRLCWTVTGDGAQILDRAIPDRPDVLRQYLAFLLGENRIAAAEPVARKLLASPQKEDADLLIAGFDAFALRNTAAALAIWNTLSARGLIPYPQLDPERGVSLTNGDVSRVPMFRGFDWRASDQQGVSVALASPPGLAVSLSGRQAESCELFYQLVPVVSGQSYRLSCGYETRELSSDAGLGWRISDASLSRIWEQAKTPRLARGGASQRLSFTVPEGSTLARIGFVYQRALGTVRIEGGVTVRGIKLEREEHMP